MHNMILKSLVLTALLCLASTIIAQSTNWLYVADEVSRANTVSMTSDGSFLVVNRSTEVSAANNVAKVSSTGRLDWEVDLDLPNPKTVIYAAELPDLDLVFVTNDGEIYRVGPDGTSAVLINQLNPVLAAQISALRYDVANQDEIYFIGSATNASIRQTLRATFNLSSLAVTTNLGPDEPFPNGVAFSSTGIRAELFTDGQTSSIDFLDANLVVTSSVDLAQTGIVFFSDLTFDINGNLYVTGSEGVNDNVNLQTGVIVSIDSNGTFNWIKRIPRPAGLESLSLKHVLSRDGRIFIAGRSGPTILNLDVFVAEIDLEGNLLWETTFDVSGGLSFAESLDVVEGSNADELIVLGTGGFTDFSGPERTFLASIILNTSSTSDHELVHEPYFYPTPVRDLLHIASEHAFKSIEVIDTKGSILGLLPTGTTTVDMSGYTPGVYFFRVNYDGFSQTTKVIRD